MNISRSRVVPQGESKNFDNIQLQIIFHKQVNYHLCILLHSILLIAHHIYQFIITYPQKDHHFASMKQIVHLSLYNSQNGKCHLASCSLAYFISGMYGAFMPISYSFFQSTSLKYLCCFTSSAPFFKQPRRFEISTYNRCFTRLFASLLKSRGNFTSPLSIF